jgi:hypothetical protein
MFGMRRMAPTNIMVAGSTNGLGAGEWVGNLLWWGAVFAGIAVLCVALVWATQEEQVARSSGGHRRVPRREPRNPWIERIRQMTQCVGTWLMMILVPQVEPSQGAERRRTCANPEGQRCSSMYRGAAPRQGCQNEPRPHGGSVPNQGRQCRARSQRESVSIPT